MTVKQPKSKLESQEKICTFLLLSDDKELEDLVTGLVNHPWKLIRQGAGELRASKTFSQLNVRLVLLDDQAVDENDRGWLLAQIRKHFSGTLLYVAASQSDGNEQRARTNGAQYYISKPLPLERFGYVLRSFLRMEQGKRNPGTRARKEENIDMHAKESTAANPSRIDAGIRRLSDELNREDSQLRSCLLDAALTGLRLSRNPESRDLRRDTARIWAEIEPILSHHLDTEDSHLLPWLDRQGGLSAEIGRKVRDCHHELRARMGVIAKSGADHITEAQARDAGQAMSGLAVSLDDAIDDEERRLFPMIQKALFAREHQV